MKYIPILFSTLMVQALLASRKTMTRRVVKALQPDTMADDKGWSTKYTYFTSNATGENIFNRLKDKCPYGKVGDVLWVRETWSLITPYGPEDYYFGYKINTGVQIKASSKYDYASPDIWRPSIHMPKEACRLFLEITNIRVERLQDITGEDALSEGVEVNTTFPVAIGDAYRGFQKLWQSINGPESWEANPWVWVIEFKQIDKPDNF